MTLKQLNKMVQEKYPGVEVVKGNGYFYLYSEDDEIGLKIAGLYQSSILIAKINNAAPEQWMNIIGYTLSDGYRLECDRSPVFPSKNE